MRIAGFTIPPIAALMLAAILGLGTASVAQTQTDAAGMSILTIESDRFFSESAFGRRVTAEIEAASQDLAAENREIEAALTEEEKDLTRKRATMDPEDFRVLADAFDTKVQGIRRSQDAKGRALAGRGDKGRVAFLRAARPVLSKLMHEFGASIIMERGSVFFSSNASDITDEAIRMIDAEIGDGSDSDLLDEDTTDPDAETNTETNTGQP
ncbi:MAG: outer membrane chaperone Skp [Rhodobacteraceae bacterium]|nr:outer membrane chaperone Skp [Paracoccaceae bacterium]MAY46719.1 outer membrane chaperone Skp [Paracoccaceae bacterium]